MANNQNNGLQVNITPEDNMVCDCGCEYFVPCYNVARVKNPLIGQPDIVAPMPHPSGFICSSCGKLLDTKNTKTKREAVSAAPPIITP